MTKRNRKKLIYFIISLCILGFGALTERLGWNVPQTNIEPVDQIVEPGTYRVLQAEDGDTITIDMDGRKERVRFIGVDTPETQDPRKPVQCFGRVASEFTKDKVTNKNVRLEADPENTNRDRYNRLLRYVFLPDGTLLNAEIIKQGYGFAYTSFPFTKKDEFKAYEQEARSHNKGLWGNCQTGTDENGYNTINPEINP